MQRRGESGQQAKRRPKARKVPTAHGSTDHSPEQFDRLKRERDEALEQQAATAEVLTVISRSPGELEPVFSAILENATRICEAQIAEIVLVENNVMRTVAGYGDAQRLPRSEMVPLDRSTVMGRSICDQKPVHVADLQNAGDEFARGREFAKKFGHRTILCVPLIREARALGTILVRRMEVRPFEQKHIALLKTFADQAAIAIENVRLFKGEQQRTRELSESLEQQTATSEVLKVISSSPGDMKPVFEAMLENALRICEAKFGHLLLYDGERFHATHLHDVPASYREFWRQHGPIKPSSNTGLARLASTKQVAHIPDLKADSAYAEREPLRVITVEQAGARSLVAVPMLKENKLIGAIVIYRQELRPFTDKQIELLMNFAAQAVIAIENTRLLNELRESLQQQTATAGVLRVISRSTFDLQPVLGTLIENATKLCAAEQGFIFRTDGELYHLAADYNAPAGLRELVYRHARPRRPGDGSVVGRVAVEGRTIQILDAQADADWRAFAQATPDISRIRTLLGVPMRREGVLIGAIAMWRTEVRAFSAKELALVETFADQAVIAIENARLLNELRQSLQQQPATAD